VINVHSSETFSRKKEILAKNERQSEIYFFSEYQSHVKRKYNNNCANYSLFLIKFVKGGEDPAVR